MHKKIKDLLSALDLEARNPGAYAGYQWSSKLEMASSFSINPSNGEEIAAVSPATLQDYFYLRERAHHAFLTWREVPAPKRGELVRQLGQALRAHKSLLGDLISLEMGKTKQEADGEVQEMIDMADFAVGQSRMLYGKTMHSERSQHRMYEQWQPYGLVGIISAFNFPVAVWAWNAFLAAIAGNVCIWKPSHKTFLSAIAVQKICNRILEDNNYPAIFNLFISQDKALRAAFVEDKNIPLLSFTGSTAAGKEVAQKVAARFGRSILELGGNNALILMPSADLALALPAIVFGAIGTAGQRCTSTRRLFVHESCLETVKSQLIKAYQQVKCGDPLDASMHMGPLIDEKAVQSYCNTLERIKAQGGRIFFGGKVIKKKGYFVEPTLVDAIENSWDVVQEETFAPILYVMPFRELDEAIAMQNAVPQGLSSSLFTQNLKEAELFLSATGSDCGIANINLGTSGAEIGGAFGGEKETGGGREAGSDAWKSYMRRQTNTINWSSSLALAQGIQFKVF